MVHVVSTLACSICPYIPICSICPCSYRSHGIYPNTLQKYKTTAVWDSRNPLKRCGTPIRSIYTNFHNTIFVLNPFRAKHIKNNMSFQVLNFTRSLKEPLFGLEGQGGIFWICLALKAKIWYICSLKHASTMPTHANSIDTTGLPRPKATAALLCPFHWHALAWHGMPQWVNI